MRSIPQRVLIVDDDTMVADTLQLIFEKSGFDVRSSNSAEEALLCAREFRPDLMLCDLIMPGRNGLSLLQDITSELPGCRILVLTGFYSQLNDVEKHARRLPCPVGILTKPCLPTDLLREANAMLAIA